MSLMREQRALLMPAVQSQNVSSRRQPLFLSRQVMHAALPQPQQPRKDLALHARPAAQRFSKLSWSRPQLPRPACTRKTLPLLHRHLPQRHALKQFSELSPGLKVPRRQITLSPSPKQFWRTVEAAKILLSEISMAWGPS
jgi:hypothetical protein